MEKVDPEWHAREFIRLYAKFMGALQHVYSDCARVATEATFAHNLLDAPQVVRDDFLAQWHAAMDVNNGYAAVAARNSTVFRNAVCQRVDMATKWDASDIDAATRDTIWLYYIKLNKHARFCALAPRNILQCITELQASGADPTTPQVMETIMQRVAGNYEELMRATDLLGDILQDMVGEDAAAGITGMLETLKGGNGALPLEQLTALLPMLDSTGQMGSILNQLQNTDSDPAMLPDPAMLSAALKQITGQLPPPPDAE